MCMAWGRFSTSITTLPPKMIPTEDALRWRDCMCGEIFLVHGRGSPLAHHCTNVPHHQCPEKGTQDDHINMTTQWYKQALYLHSWTVFPVRCPPTAQGGKRYRKSLRTVNDNNNIKKVTINMSKPKNNMHGRERGREVEGKVERQ